MDAKFSSKAKTLTQTIKKLVSHREVIFNLMVSVEYELVSFE
jgi:hypothetical protein